MKDRRKPMVEDCKALSSTGPAGVGNVGARLAATILFCGGLFLPYASAQPTPEPEPWEVIDAPAVRKMCMGTNRAIQPSEMACILNAIARLPKQVDPATRALYGANYDPEGYLRCVQKRPDGDPPIWTGSCDYLLLQRHPAPEYWPYPDTPRPKLPLPDLDKYYRPGIEQKEYFNALCRNLAGEFVYRTAENVEGIYQIRPRHWAGDRAREDPYVIEDPYGYFVSEGAGSLGIYLGRDGYIFAEAPNVSGSRKGDHPYIRYVKPRIEEFARTEPAESVQAQYGYTWRDITRTRERELGIAGGDLFVVDLRTGEVLGMRRGFARSVISKNTIGGRNWAGTENCPLVEMPGGFQYRSPGLDLRFMRKVVKPAPKHGN